MVETTGEGDPSPGPNASVDPKGADGMTTVLKLIADRAVDHRGGLNLDSASLEGLRTQEGREAFLRDFVVAMMPERLNPAIWLGWLNGSARPFEKARLSRVDGQDQSLGRALERSSKRVARAALGVANARKSTEAASRREIEAEKELVEARAFDAATIEYAVSEHLLGIMAPMFAMGPAWTVMRAVSAHISAEQMTEELDLLHDQRKRAEEPQRILRKREESTDRILDVLDRWCGDYVFEMELRDAIEVVVKRYMGRERPDAARRARSSMKASVSDAESTRDRDEVLEGMSRPAQ